MNELITLLIPAAIGFLALRLLMLPIRWVFKLAIHSASGFACLWLLNTISGFTGILFPINPVTVLAAGILGLPGIGILALLEIL